MRDATFLVQRVRMSGTPTESSILIGPAAEERQLLMQRMYELIVDGHLPELCQHPSLGCPAFLGDFRDFCTRHKNYVQRLVNAVDTTRPADAVLVCVESRGTPHTLVSDGHDGTQHEGKRSVAESPVGRLRTSSVHFGRC